MIADPTPGTQATAPPVVWRDLRHVPPHGLGRAPRPLQRPRATAYLRQVWQLPGRSRQAPARARSLVTDTCRVWRIPRAIAEDLAVITSELATNAVVHAPGPTVGVALLLTAREAWVVVIDHGPRRSIEPRHAADDDEHGRGLSLVAALASRCGNRRAGTGTAAWACIELPDTAPYNTEKEPTDARSHP